MELRHAPVGEASIFEDLGSTWYRLRFRYHDGNGWKDEFDSLDADQLPVAIEVMVWFNPWPGEEPMDVFEAPEESERLTFDDRGGFDEFDAAFETDIAEFAGEPLPDRIRVFLIPDADACVAILDVSRIISKVISTLAPSPRASQLSSNDSA